MMLTSVRRTKKGDGRNGDRRDTARAGEGGVDARASSLSGNMRSSVWVLLPMAMEISVVVVIMMIMIMMMMRRWWWWW